MARPLVSVIIPALNEEAYLPKLLTDLKNQTESRFEVLVVDGTSEDATVAKALAFSDCMSIRVLTTKKRNVSYQRNLGARKAKGDYLFFLDADFRLDSDFFQVLRSRLEKYRYLMYVPALEPQRKTSLHDSTYTSISSFLSSVSNALNNPYVPSSTLLVQKDFFRYLGGYDESIVFGEDQEIVQRAFTCGVRTRMLNHPCVRMSFRRFEKYGSLNIYAKYIVGLLFTNTNSKIEEEMFEYEMGGHVYGAGREKSGKPQNHNERVGRMGKNDGSAGNGEQSLRAALDALVNERFDQVRKKLGSVFSIAEEKK
jgi:glycosyltransferase involved in cell wall biosynthesis